MVGECAKKFIHSINHLKGLSNAACLFASLYLHHYVKIGSFLPLCSSSRCIKINAVSASLESPAL
jgi:hypothetical protein